MPCTRFISRRLAKRRLVRDFANFGVKGLLNRSRFLEPVIPPGDLLQGRGIFCDSYKRRPFRVCDGCHNFKFSSHRAFGATGERQGHFPFIKPGEWPQSAVEWRLRPLWTGGNNPRKRVGKTGRRASVPYPRVGKPTRYGPIRVGRFPWWYG